MKNAFITITRQGATFQVEIAPEDHHTGYTNADVKLGDTVLFECDEAIKLDSDEAEDAYEALSVVNGWADGDCAEYGLDPLSGREMDDRANAYFGHRSEQLERRY